MSWNLMCRAANTEAIRFAHMGWKEDALAIKFSHMKNNQEGDRPGDARHVYANPVIPEVCPILPLAVYCMVSGFSSDDRLFPGNRQYDRYTKVLKRAMDRDSVRSELEKGGFVTSDFGSHSARKGLATFVSSCSTSGPPARSICLRAGWSLLGVQDTYIRFEVAGDMVVGRFVSDLPFECPEFAVQQPFFAATNAVIDGAIALCFPSAPRSFGKVCEFCLASVAYHASFLLQELPSTHALLQTPLFRNRQLLNAGRSAVVCRGYRPEDPIRPTDVPGHIGQVVRLERLEKLFERVIPGVRVAVREEMREGHMQQGCVAVAMETMLTAVLQKHGVVPSPTPQEPQETPTPEPRHERAIQCVVHG